VVQSGENDIHQLLLGRPQLAIDWKYLFLALVGFLYLAIGFFTLARDRAPATRIFWGICLSSFAINVITPIGPHDTVWRALWFTEYFYRALLPPLLLHFFLLFPAPLVARRWIAPLYLPGLAYLALQEAPFFTGSLDPTRTFLLARQLWLLLFAVYGAA